MSIQTAITSPVPRHAAFLFLHVQHDTATPTVFSQVQSLRVDDSLVVGLGSSLLARCEADVLGMRPMPSLAEAPIAIPVTPHHLFLRVSGADPGEVLHRERAIMAQLPAFEVADRVEGFMYGPSRDLSGYEDGTENPTGEDALRAAFQMNQGPGLDGSSVLAIQRWEHDLDVMERFAGQRMNNLVGRDRQSNEELEDAPESAHVKRTAQEDFEPEAFVLRRSMPWRDHRGAGLVFLSFSSTLYPFEAQLRRMVGLDDGIIDGLFAFTRPVTGATFWCPPVNEELGRLDLRACHR